MENISAGTHPREGHIRQVRGGGPLGQAKSVSTGVCMTLDNEREQTAGPV